MAEIDGDNAAYRSGRLAALYEWPVTRPQHRSPTHGHDIATTRPRESINACGVKDSCSFAGGSSWVSGPMPNFSNTSRDRGYARSEGDRQPRPCPSEVWHSQNRCHSLRCKPLFQKRAAKRQSMSTQVAKWPRMRAHSAANSSLRDSNSPLAKTVTLEVEAIMFQHPIGFLRVCLLRSDASRSR
jgi:hypothetical protein